MLRLRPILLRPLAAGLIGAVVTVGVAVGCAMRIAGPAPVSPDFVLWIHPVTGDEFAWRPVSESWGTRSADILWVGSKHQGLLETRPLLEDSPCPSAAFPSDPAHHWRIVRIVGWPCECAWGALAATRSDTNDGPFRARPSPFSPRAIAAIPVGRPLDVDDEHGIGGYLPIAPIWSGLAINTLFYGTIAWVLLFLPGTVRRWRRRRVGRCVQCAYDRAGLAAGAPCPECGGGAAR